MFRSITGAVKGVTGSWLHRAEGMPHTFCRGEAGGEREGKTLSHIVAAHEGMKGVRLSMSDYRDQTWMENIPMFAVLYAP